MEEKVIYSGSDIKMKIDLDFDGKDEDVIDFEVRIHIGNAMCKVPSNKMISTGVQNQYLVCVKAKNTLKGEICAFIATRFRDGDFEDNVHVVVKPVKMIRTVVK